MSDQIPDVNIYAAHMLETERALATAQAEVARLKEELERADEANDESEQVRRVVAEGEVARLRWRVDQLLVSRDAGIANEKRDEAEVAALRRVLMTLIRGAETASPEAMFSLGQDGLRQAHAALSAPSSAEPLLADIRAAVEAMNQAALFVAQKDDCLCPSCAAGVRIDEALTGLRRWVP